jgi:lysine 6-dehydrogenase
MPKFVILGAGRQGICAAYDLTRFHPGTVVLLVDNSDARLRFARARLSLLSPNSRLELASCDAAHPEELAKFVKPGDVVLSCVPYRLNFALCEATVALAAHFCDLGGNTAIVKQELGLHETAKKNGISVVPDCGLAPGLGNTLAAHAIQQFEAPSSSGLPGGECETIAIYCGGLPQRPQGPLNYHLLFSVEGLINEYTGFAIELRDGQIVRIPTLTEMEAITLPGDLGQGEAIVTSGGTSTAPESFRSRVKNYSYKTIRYSGHWEKIKAFDELGFFSADPIILDDIAAVGEKSAKNESTGRSKSYEISPRRVTEALFSKNLVHPDGKDLTVLMVKAYGTKNGRPQQLTQTLLDYFDDVTGFSAMERTTAYPAACVAEMQMEGLIAPGAIPLELSVPPKPFLSRLAKRGLRIDESWV